MLIEASADNPRTCGEPRSPHFAIAYHRHHVWALSSRCGLVEHASTPIGDPLDRSDELRTYRTHISAPPVTGPPMYNGKPGSSARIGEFGPQSETSRFPLPYLRPPRDGLIALPNVPSTAKLHTPPLADAPDSL
ncbi:hypothetical protein HYDPIDRAFT_36690 [Hydnomerulius pinastri MD-312]|nr:hypothetical protein HYDPIDRAFT_36690 [Hydnomerulius pinastri MD-312]